MITRNGCIIEIIKGVFCLIIIFIMIFLFTGGEHLGDKVIKEKTIISSVNIQKHDDKGNLLDNSNSDATGTKYIKDILPANAESYSIKEYRISYDIDCRLIRALSDSNNVIYKGKECSETMIDISTTLYVPKGYMNK